MCAPDQSPSLFLSPVLLTDSLFRSSYLASVVWRRHNKGLERQRRDLNTWESDFLQAAFDFDNHAEEMMQSLYTCSYPWARYAVGRRLCECIIISVICVCPFSKSILHFLSFLSSTYTHLLHTRKQFTCNFFSLLSIRFSKSLFYPPHVTYDKSSQ